MLPCLGSSTEWTGGNRAGTGTVALVHEQWREFSSRTGLARASAVRRR